MAHYLDTSAMMKLVVAEDETSALRRWLEQPDRTPVSSDLARAELMGAVRRAAPDRVVQARAVLEAMTLVRLDTSTFEEAGRLGQNVLRTLDALHLAAAIELGDDLDTIVTYDQRMEEAALANGVRVTALR